MALDVICPKHCPELRADIIAFLQAPGPFGAATMLSWMESRDDYGRLRAFGPREEKIAAAASAARIMAASLSAAELFIIAKHKVKDVLEAAAEIPLDMDVQRHWFHNDHGIMFFEKPVIMNAFSKDAETQHTTPVAAISWSITGGIMRVTAWADTSKFLGLTAKEIPSALGERPVPLKDVRRVAAAVGPLISCASLVTPLGQYMSSIGSEDDPRHPQRVLLSACLMLKQYVTARSVVEAPRSSWRRINAINPQLGKSVTVIDKREVKKNPTNEDVESPSSRVLSVRYDRRGHWREYKSERFSPELREHPIWIPAHWVGHEGLPLATRSKVTRLTR